jgi:hypothetical protein
VVATPAAAAGANQASSRTNRICARRSARGVSVTLDDSSRSRDCRRQLLADRPHGRVGVQLRRSAWVLVVPRPS